MRGEATLAGLRSIFPDGPKPLHERIEERPADRPLPSQPHAPCQRERLEELLELEFDELFELVLDELFEDVLELVFEEVFELEFEDELELVFDATRVRSALSVATGLLTTVTSFSVGAGAACAAPTSAAAASVVMVTVFIMSVVS
jgi:hypothetical protein